MKTWWQWGVRGVWDASWFLMRHTELTVLPFVQEDEFAGEIMSSVWDMVILMCSWRIQERYLKGIWKHGSGVLEKGLEM